MPLELLTPGTVDPIDPSALASYGPVGVFAALVMTALGFMFRRYDGNRDKERDALIKLLGDERIRADRIEGELSKLNNMIQTQVMTALHESTRALTDAIAKFRRER